MSRLLGGLISALALIASGWSPAFADVAGKHPHYVHAMEYLRDAYTILSHAGDYRPGVDMRIDFALRDIKYGYADIEKAGLNDGKTVDGGMPPERSLDRQGRLHRAEEALQRALQDVSLEEDDSRTQGLRDRATVQINRAIDHIHHAFALVH